VNLSSARGRTCLGIGLSTFVLLVTGCESQPPDLKLISNSIAESDSLHRRQIDHRSPQSWEGYPIATSVDSDSVAWLNASPDTMFTHSFVQ